MLPAEYLRQPRCGCLRERAALAKAREDGAPLPLSWRVDRYRDDGREQRGRTCLCLGYSHPHYRGRGWCDHNDRLTAEDFQRRHESGAWS